MAAEPANYCTGAATVSIGSDIGIIKSPDGAVLTPTVELFEPNDAEQLNTPPKGFILSETFQFACTFLEPSQTNLPLAMGTEATLVTPGPPITLEIGATQVDTVERVIAVTGFGAEGGTLYDRTLNIYRAVVSSPPEYKISKSQLTELAVVYDCLYDDTTNDAVFEFSDAIIV